MEDQAQIEFRTTEGNDDPNHSLRITGKRQAVLTALEELSTKPSEGEGDAERRP